jgi:hypothetical protein
MPHRSSQIAGVQVAIAPANVSAAQIMASEETPTNSLGLDFDRLKINEPDPQSSETSNTVVDAPPEGPAPHDVATGPNQTEKEKKKPYINPERVKTGGIQRVSVSLSLIVMFDGTDGAS